MGLTNQPKFYTMILHIGATDFHLLADHTAICNLNTIQTKKIKHENMQKGENFMKKKGLIIATIVMVLVLAVSLTTATYAWFTVATVTTVDGFDVSVVAGSDVIIGLKENNTYDAGAIGDHFWSGTVTYTKKADGAIGGGTWEGTIQGLSATIDHTIPWGQQSKAVGVTTVAVDQITTATVDNTGLWNQDGGKTVIAANGNNLTSIDAANADAAIANKDYVYFFLGVQPVKDLTTNQIVVLLDADEFTGNNAGILSALHIAYRHNSDGAWTDVDLFGADETTGVHYDDALKAPVLDGTQANVYKESYEVSAIPTKGAAWSLDLGKVAGKIDQLELVIYLAGEDTDCLQGSLNGAKGKIKIFFVTDDGSGN